MSLSDMLKEILRQAEKEVQAIEAELEEAKKALSQELATQHQQKLEEVGQRGEKALTKMEEKIQQMARREKAKRLAEGKKGIVATALDRLVERLSKGSDELYQSFCQHQLQSLQNQEGKMLVPQGKSALVQNLAGSSHTVEESADVPSGFQFVSKTFSVDNTFENVVHSQYRAPLEVYFAKHLKLVS